MAVLTGVDLMRWNINSSVEEARHCVSEDRILLSSPQTTTHYSCKSSSAYLSFAESTIVAYPLYILEETGPTLCLSKRNH